MLTDKYLLMFLILKTTMKKLLLLNSTLVILFPIAFATALYGQSPDWQWVKSMGGIGDEGGSSIAIDRAGSGNVYTTGGFNGTVDFNPGAPVFNLTSAGGIDIFISKSDSSGNFVWAKAIGGTGWDQGICTTIDPSGSGYVYTTGNFQGIVDFDPGAGIFNLTSIGPNDFFISKLDSSGNFIWAKQMGGTDAASSSSIAIAPSGSSDVYTTGSFYGTIDFDPGPGVFNLTSTGNSDIFISKLDSSGNFLWAKGMEGTGAISYDRGVSIAVDPAGSGSLYTTGQFQETIDFDPGVGVFNLTSSGHSYDIYICKLDSSGNFLWAKQMGGTDSDWGQSVAIDPEGNSVYTIGTFEGTVDFDPGAGIFNLTSVGFLDTFISKLDSSGNFTWVKVIGGVSYEYGESITIDPAGSGDIYTTGTFQDTVDFDPGTGVFILTTGGIGDPDIYISKLDSSGNFVWAKSAGEYYHYEYSSSIALDASGNTYITGSFDGTSIAFGNITLMNADSNGTYSDIFIAKLNTATVTRIKEKENSGKDILISSNPVSNSTTISFSLTQALNISLRIYDLNGRLVETLADKIFNAGENEIRWDAEEMEDGIYFLQFLSAENLQVKKLIVAK
jgi:hypothetical protein